MQCKNLCLLCTQIISYLDHFLFCATFLWLLIWLDWKISTTSMCALFWIWPNLACSFIEFLFTVCCVFVSDSPLRSGVPASTAGPTVTTSPAHDQANANSGDVKHDHNPSFNKADSKVSLKGMVLQTISSNNKKYIFYWVNIWFSLRVHIFECTLFKLT